MKFVVGEKRVMDVEVRAPYNWLVRWQRETEGGVELQERGLSLWSQ